MATLFFKSGIPAPGKSMLRRAFYDVSGNDMAPKMIKE